MEIIIIVCLILLNGFFSMSEIAIVSARRSQLQTQANKGDKTAKIALRLLENPNNFLSTIQIGITLIGILTGIYSGATLSVDFEILLQRIGLSSKYSSSISQIGIVAIVTYLSIVFGELIPKNIGMNQANKIARIVARPMYILSIIMTPFVLLLSKSTSIISKVLGTSKSDNHVTEEEIKSMINEGTATGEVSIVEQDILERVFSLGDRQIISLMTPRVELVWIDVNLSRENLIKLIQDNPHSVYPVADKTIDNILGIVSLKDLFSIIHQPSFELHEIIKQPLSLHENTNVYDAFTQMKENLIHYAIIYDEFGSIQGVVSSQDILEGLVGELPDNKSDVSIVQRNDNSWFVDGQCEFYHFLDYFDLLEVYNTKRYNTISGLILQELKRIPQLGDHLYWLNLDIEIIDMDGARIDKLLVTKV